MSVVLARYDAACRALAAAHRVDEVKTIRDKAVAMQAYAKQAKDTTLITQATEIRMRAERRAGELLIEMAELGERDSGKGNRNPVLKSQAATPKLFDLGISKTQSSRWQELARISDDTFEAKITSASKRAYDGIAHRFIKEAKIEKAKRRHSNIIEHGCRVDDLIALAKSGKRFAVIYADPPWPFATWSESGKGRSPYYGTNAIDEIMRLPVAALAADDSALLLWCTGPHIAIGSHVKLGVSNHRPSRSIGSRRRPTAASTLVWAIGPVPTPSRACSRPKARRRGWGLTSTKWLRRWSASTAPSPRKCAAASSNSSSVPISNSMAASRSITGVCGAMRSRPR